MSEKPVAVRYADEVEAHAATKAELSKLQNDIAAKVKAMDEKDEEIKRLKEENEELKKKIEQYDEQDKKKDAKHTQEVADLSAKLTDVTAKLALSPAHKDVSAGAAPVKDVSAGSEKLTREQHWDAYAKITDPLKKAEYFKANRNEMEKK